MDSREADELLRSRNQDKARALLFEAMPKMQPSALKHEFLTSVANALLHPVKSYRDPEDPTVGHSIAWGDKYRRLPLVLIHDLETTQSVRHAFVPNPKSAIDAQLLKHLQQSENSLASHLGIPPRNISRQIEIHGRGEISHHGRPDLSDSNTVDAALVRKNVRTSVDLSLESTGLTTKSVDVATHPKRNTLLFRDIEFEELSNEDLEFGD